MDVERIPERVIVHFAGVERLWPGADLLGCNFFGYPTAEGATGHIIAALTYSGDRVHGHYQVLETGPTTDYVYDGFTGVCRAPATIAG